MLGGPEGVDDLVLERDERDDAAEDEDGDDEGDCVRVCRMSIAHAERVKGRERGGRTGREGQEGSGRAEKARDAPRLRGCLSHSGLRYLRTMPLRSQERDLPASASASEGVGLGVRLTAAR